MVTILAFGGESGRHVARVRGRFKRFLMTPLTVHRSSGVELILGSLVAGLAVSDSVHSSEREPFLGVQSQLVLAVFPVPGGMAVLTGQTYLTLVVIGMAIHARRTDVGKFQILVTANTLRGSMSPGQTEAGLIVVEIHGLFKLVPGGRRMAVLAVPFQFSMRILT